MNTSSMIATTQQAEYARHAATLASWLKAAPQNSVVATELAPPKSIIEWGEQNFWIPSESNRPRLIKFLPHQKVILSLFFDGRFAEALGCAPNFQTLIYSTIKKSGKTAIAALVARWIAETWGSHGEVYCMANDLEQARGRIYQAALSSVELDPRYSRADKGIAGLWRIIERVAMYLPTHSTLKAVSVDYKGEAGSNPVASLWSELWGYSSEAGTRLWEELTPVPTRPRSIRYVETYAGYEGESSILNDLEDRVKKEGRRLEYDELSALLSTFSPTLSWPYSPDQPLPFFVHPASRTFAYWDEGVAARRMPWQTEAYYSVQRTDLRPAAYERLHENKRVSPTEAFVPAEWWDRLVDKDLPPFDKNTPLVVGADAGVTGDCTGILAVSRDPRPGRSDCIIVRLVRAWQPEGGKPLNYSETIDPALREWCREYNIVQVAYDQYQLHYLMSRLRDDAVTWVKSFSQMGDRMIADKALFDLIRDAKISHSGDPALREHILNTAAKYPPDDNTKLRIVKKSAKSKIDLAVCLSMACHESLRLNLS